LVVAACVSMGQEAGKTEDEKVKETAKKREAL
jgi:hypothetical protein